MDYGNNMCFCHIRNKNDSVIRGWQLGVGCWLGYLGIELGQDWKRNWATSAVPCRETPPHEYSDPTAVLLQLVKDSEHVGRWRYPCMSCVVDQLP